MSVSVLMVRALVQVCSSRHISRSDLLKDTGLETLDLQDLRLRVPEPQFALLADRTISLTQDAGIGLSLGVEVPEHALQVVGYLVRSAPSLRAAYEDFTRYATLLADNPTWSLREQGNEARLEFNSPMPQPTIQRMANDWAMSLAYRCIRSFASDAAHFPSQIELTHARPSYGHRYGSVFDCEVRFRRMRTLLVFPRALLDRPQLHGDPMVCSTLRTTAEQLLERNRSAEPLADRVRSQLRHQADLTRVGVESIAQHAGLSQSALRRALALQGLSPSALVDEELRGRACAELEVGGRPVKSIAEALGYADRSSFARAFRRWTGTTPAAYRKSRGGRRS